MDYVELHCHSNFSLLDGASTPEALVITRAAELGMPALALTDHDAVYGAVRFSQAAQTAGIKPILGAELPLDDNSHLTLLVENQTGWHHLNWLISQARAHAPKGEAALPVELLDGHTEGLIALSGCPQGAIPLALRRGDREGAVQIARQYREWFGPGSFWIELQHHLRPQDKTLVRGLAGLAEAVGLEVVATNNVHYARREGHRLQDVLVCIREHTPLAEHIATEPATMPDRVVVQWDKYGIEDSGLVKIDILGLRMLSVLAEAVEIIAETTGEQVDLDGLSFDDKVVFAMLQAGDTVGVFQVESRAQTQLQPRLKPESFEDLITSVSLIRPGPIQGNMVHPYLRRRAGVEPVTYLHPKLKPLLEESLGVVIYQEQVLQIVRELAGLSAGQGEALRRALGSDLPGEVIEQTAGTYDRLRAGDARIGIGGGSRPPPSHTTGHAGPHPAVRSGTTKQILLVEAFQPPVYPISVVKCPLKGRGSGKTPQTTTGTNHPNSVSR